ncbi:MULTISPECIES: hypothetical protein [unclassified Rhizobium]|uniref:hypothetical protein n=1 Tax=unclassified Rhizobium TaxID=2613769 RepID=UPI001ADC6890|nr:MULTISPECIES: hypothetical protein [unclassified Rhizobium]MBO9124823.1 hypothetical protein [Rhizobium sp. 16-488-2b]MBO9175407.1 hypothetical protein [Rhizobium sp. 16-488-2a]
MSPFDNLPLFATDIELATAIVGKARAKEWAKARLPTLSNRPGFPKFDEFHGGWPVALVAAWYENSWFPGQADRSTRELENPSAWKKSRRPAKTVWSGPPTKEKPGAD